MSQRRSKDKKDKKDKNDKEDKQDKEDKAVKMVSAIYLETSDDDSDRIEMPEELHGKVHGRDFFLI